MDKLEKLRAMRGGLTPADVTGGQFEAAYDEAPPTAEYVVPPPGVYWRSPVTSPNAAPLDYPYPQISYFNNITQTFPNRIMYFGAVGGGDEGVVIDSISYTEGTGTAEDYIIQMTGPRSGSLEFKLLAPTRIAYGKVTIAFRTISKGLPIQKYKLVVWTSSGNGSWIQWTMQNG